jgi:hypothetical protein
LAAAAERALKAGRAGVAALLVHAAADEAAPEPDVALTVLAARVALAQGAPARARRLADAALLACRGDPDEAAEALLWRARAGAALGDAPAAVADARAALVHAPARADAAGLCGTLLMDRGDCAGAEAVMRGALARGARDPALSAALALALAGQGDAAAARLVLDEAAMAFPSHDGLRALRSRL